MSASLEQRGPVKPETLGFREGARPFPRCQRDQCELNATNSALHRSDCTVCSQFQVYIDGFNVSYQEKPNFMLCSALVHRPVVESGVFRELVSNLLFFFFVFCLFFILYGLNVDIKLNLSSSDYFSFEGLLKA